MYLSWDRGVADQRFVIDDFSGCGEPITHLTWWGNTCAVWDGPDCDLPDYSPFVVRFYADDGTGAPDLDNLLCAYDPVYAQRRYTTLWWCRESSVQHLPFGRVERFTATLAPACDLPAGWISIASKNTDCDFAWAPAAASGPQFFYDNGILTEQTDENRAFCLYTTVLTGACCYEDTGVCANGVAETMCLSSYGVFYEDTLCTEVTCEPALGACCDHATDIDNCTLTLMADCAFDWLGPHSTCDECCVVICPPEGTPEGEPVCHDGYIDTYNNGCFTDPDWTFPDDWLHIEENEVLCGQMGTYTTGEQNLRDFDWYYYHLSDPVALVEAHVKGEFQPDVYLLDATCPPTVISHSCGDDCDEAIASATLLPGTYFVAVSCYGTVDCGTPYNLEIETSEAGCCRLEIDPEDVLLEFESTQNVCLAFGGTWEAVAACGSDCLKLADSNCDGAVNSFDIDAFVLALTYPSSWPHLYSCNYFCANDLNCDGMVNAFDIDPFVACLTGGGCGQCDHGACCLPDGTCEVLSSYACSAAGGVHHGPDTVCEPDLCEYACCVDWDCIGDFSKSLCDVFDGYWALGERCDAGFECEGACCLDDMECLDTYADVCATMGGEFIPGAQCSDDPCPQACCLGTECELYTEADCAMLGGLFVGGPCTPDLCVGACCDDYDGTPCEDDWLRGDCTVDDGFDQPRFVPGGTCADLDPPCGIIGACCLDSHCIGDVTNWACDEAGGVWYEGESCAGGFICPGACCFDDMCVFLFEDDCIAASGVYVGGPCDPNPCIEYGACCDDYDGDPCEDDWPADQCTTAFGFDDPRFVPGVTCAELDPPCPAMGACCIGIHCVADVSHWACDQADGIWYEGESCGAGFVCPQ